MTRAGRRARGRARRVVAMVLLAVAVARVSARDARGWGFVAHRLVVEAAARDVPEPLRGFFAPHAARLSDLSLEPDTVLKPSDPDESARHFIELDSLLDDPADARGLPADFAAARERFGAARLARAGVLAWWIADRAAALTRAMREGDGEAVLVLSGHLSHYVADLHQPLHLTHNFDGQETGNDGVHSAFERFLVERRRDSFRPSPAGTQPPRPLGDPARWALTRAAEVFPSAREVLDADTEATLAVKKQGADYYRALDRRAGPLARRLLEQSSRATTALWVSSWIDAGRPDPRRWRAPAVRPQARPGPSRRSGASREVEPGMRE